MHSASVSLNQSVQTPPRFSRWALAVVVGGISVVTLLHYLTSAHLLPYHSIYRTLYYVPITTAAVAFGQRTGLIAAAVVILAYLPHIVGMGETMPGGMVDNLLELPLFVLIAGLVGYIADRERILRRRTEHLSAYVEAVLQSLPVGVATSMPHASAVPHNRAAHTLLPVIERNIALPTLTPGYHTLDHGQRPLGVYVSPLYRDNDHDHERVYVLEDLTDRRALEAQLRRMDRLASVGQLAAGIAHEVRNPLAIVRATAQLLGGHLHADPSVMTYTEVLIKESDRIEGLISQLLDYARPRPPLLASCDLGTLLRTAAHQISPYAMQHQVAVEVDTPQAGAVSVDEEQIHQVLINLLLNAIQASPPGTTVRLAGTTGPHEAMLVVSDEGSGMPAAVLERAWDPFFTTRADGVGLGLALVAAIIQEHRGSCTIASEVGRGTTVTIMFPQEAADGERTAD